METNRREYKIEREGTGKSKTHSYHQYRAQTKGLQDPPGAEVLEKS